MTGNAIIETQILMKKHFGYDYNIIIKLMMSIACQNQIDVQPRKFTYSLIFTLWFWLIPEKGKDRGEGVSEIILGGVKNEKHE